jgi:hypothetical protein
MMSIHTVDDVHLVISQARSANRKSVIVTFTKDDALNCLAAVDLPQLYFDQLWIIKGHIANMVLIVVHKAIMDPTSNRRTLQKQLDWKDWLAAECIQLDNYDKQNMFEPPCTAPIDASIFFWVWLYSIKHNDNDFKKVRDACDGSTRGGQTMVHGAIYAPTPQQIDFRFQIALSELIGMYLWHVDVTNAFSEAEHTRQIYYIAIIECSDIGGQTSTLTFPFLPLRLFLSSRTSNAILKARTSGKFVSIRSL